jgi:hypothetical protein
MKTSRKIKEQVPLLMATTLTPTHPTTLTPTHPTTLTPTHPITITPTHPTTLTPTHPITPMTLIDARTTKL